jgi:hypothetical protein
VAYIHNILYLYVHCKQYFKTQIFCDFRFSFKLEIFHHYKNIFCNSVFPSHLRTLGHRPWLELPKIVFLLHFFLTTKISQDNNQTFEQKFRLRFAISAIFVFLWVMCVSSFEFCCGSSMIANNTVVEPF